MTPEELRRIRNIYEQALPISLSAREAYLSRECQDEAGIRAEVDRLLKAHGNIPRWLELPAVAEAKAFARVAPPPALEAAFSAATP